MTTTISQGEGITFDVTVWADENHTTLYPLNNAVSVTYRIGDKSVDGTFFENTYVEKAAIIVDVVLSLVRVTIDPADTINLSARDYDHQLKVIDAVQIPNVVFDETLTIAEALDAGDGIIDGYDLTADRAVNAAEFLPYVLPYLPGIPRALALSHIVDVIGDFCEQARCWRQILRPIDVVASQAVYFMTLPWKSEIVQVESLYLEQQPLSPVDQAEMLGVTQPRGYTRYRDKILLHPTPQVDVVGALKVMVSLKPQHHRDTCPETILQNWRTAIANGAQMRAKLMRTEKEPFSWTDREGAAACASIYNTEINRAMADRRGFGDGKPYRMTGPSIFRGRRRINYGGF